ncbi:endonuclease III [bacterium]|nr:endonuclease III [bacterium]MBU1982911.1 endonuclease III [bacterium]
MPSSSIKKRAQRVTEILFETYPQATCALNHQGAFELAIATILSAQCTDERVNIVTRDLFKKYRSPRAFADANPAELEEDIRSTGFFRNKAKSIIGFSKAIHEEFGGKVPKDMEELIKLPGIGRKTANVILGTAYGLATGVVVDTHVSRLTRRMELSEEKSPEKIEHDLMELIPQDDWILFSHAMIWHGRKICNARKPKCSECPLDKDCPKTGVEDSE